VFSTRFVLKCQNQEKLAKVIVTERIVVHFKNAKPTRGELTLSSETMLHRDYDFKNSVAKLISDNEPQGAWCQDGRAGGKLTMTVSLCQMLL
jgi:hypothetical protein